MNRYGKEVVCSVAACRVLKFLKFAIPHFCVVTYVSLLFRVVSVLSSNQFSIN